MEYEKNTRMQNFLRFNQLTVIDEYTRHKYMELAIVATVNWLIRSKKFVWDSFW